MPCDCFADALQCQVNQYDETRSPLQGRLAFALEAAARKLVARIPGRKREKRELARHLRKLFDAFDVDCVFDVGANRGQYYRFLRHDVRYEGRIVSFEPIPELAGSLRESARHDARWIVYDCALASSPGTASFNVMAKPVFSSFLTPDDAHTAAFRDKNSISRTIEVPIRTLDGVVAELASPPRRAYLKLDTQGSDLEVLRGASSTLPRVVGLQSELSFVPIYREMPDWNRAATEIIAHGFSPSGFFSVTRDSRLLLIEVDGVFVRSAQS